MLRLTPPRLLRWPALAAPSVYSNDLSDEGAATIAAALKECPSLGSVKYGRCMHALPFRATASWLRRCFQNMRR